MDGCGSHTQAGKNRLLLKNSYSQFVNMLTVAQLVSCWRRGGARGKSEEEKEGEMEEIEGCGRSHECFQEELR